MDLGILGQVTFTVEFAVGFVGSILIDLAPAGSLDYNYRRYNHINRLCRCRCFTRGTFPTHLGLGLSIPLAVFKTILSPGLSIGTG